MLEMVKSDVLLNKIQTSKVRTIFVDKLCPMLLRDIKNFHFRPLARMCDHFETSWKENKTKDWALVQTAALVINKGVKVRLG